MSDITKTDSSYQQVIISSVRQETADIKTFFLENLDGSPIIYKAGQFITFISTHNGKEERRSYSFSSAPSWPEKTTITVKRVENGFFSRYLIDEAKSGDMLYTIGTAGLYTLPDSTDDIGQVFFFAAGAGITPVFSLIKEAVLQYPDLPLTLIYSNREIKTTLFYQQLIHLEKQFPNLKIVFLFSSSKNLLTARLSKWMVPELLNRHLKVPAEKPLFYMCGPNAYMRMVTLALEEYNIPSTKIRKENFNTTLPVFKIKPPDISQHEVRIILNNTSYQFPAQYPDSILQAAIKQHLVLPYSCNTGKCGTCVAKCTAGRVWHSYNEVLTDEDLAKGMILTCTGHPVNSDIVIEY